MGKDVVWHRRHSAEDAHRARMRAIPLFSGLADGEIDLLDQVLTEVRVDAGRRLTVLGEVGREFAIIREGLASVVRDGVEIGRLRPNTFFGEHALLTGEPRTADVVALTPMRLLVAGPAEFARLLREVPTIAERVTAQDRSRQGAGTVPAAAGAR